VFAPTRRTLRGEALRDDAQSSSWKSRALSTQLFTQEFILGIVSGSTYVLIALGFTLIYGMLRLINFAQISIYTVGAFAYIGIIDLLIKAHSLPQTFDYAIAAIGAAVAAGALGLVLVTTTWYPIRRATNFSLVVSSLASLLLLQNLIQLFVSSQPVAAANPFGGSVGSVAGVPITASDLILLLAGVIVSVLLAILIRKSRFGLSVRAVADNPTSARLVGIPYTRVVFGVFALAGALAGLAGALVAAQYGVATYDMGIYIGLNGFTAAVLGGMGNIWGALTGGLILGEISSFSITLLPSAWQQAISFGVLIVVLAIRPTGLFSTRSVERA
jgi:branched-chain amino acid transport system permease protein